MTVHHARLVHTATEIKFQVSQAHIWLEEGLLGDPTVERDTFMTHLDQAEALAVAMLEGGMGAGEPLRPVQTAGLRREIRSLRGSLAQYRSQSLERWALREQGTAQVGSPRDQRLDSVYQEVVESNQAMIEALHSKIRFDLAQFYWTLLGILVFVTVLAVLSWYSLRRYIGQRNRAIASLSRSEEDLRTTLMSIGDGVISTDTQGRVTRMNEVAQHLTAWDEKEALGRPLEEVFAIANALTGKEVEAPIHRVLREGMVVGLANHTVLTARDGTRRQIADSAAPIRVCDGEITGVVLVFRDVTEQYEQERRVQESETRFRALFELMGQGVVFHAPDGRIVDANPAAQRILGLTLDQLQARRPFEPSWKCVDNEGQDFPMSEHPAMEVLRTGEAVAGVVIGVFHPGRQKFVWIRVSAVPLFSRDSGKPLEVFASFEDITELKEAEEALRSSEAELRYLFDTAPVGIFRTTSTGRVLKVNPKMAEIVGCDSPEQALERYQDLFVDLYADSERRSVFLDRLQREGEILQFEYEGFRRNGARRWFMMNARLSGYLEDGSFLIDGFTSDITERREAQERIQHLNLVLRAIREVNQLITREKDAEQLLRKANQLMVAHRGYSSALVIRTDANGRPQTYYHAGEDNSPIFQPLAEHIEAGMLPPCCRLLDSKTEVLFVPKAEGACAGCPQENTCQTFDTLCVALRYADRFFGYIAVALPQGRGYDPEEQNLFQEAANDVAFALYTIEQEAQVKQATAERERMEDQLQQAQKMEAVGRLAGGVAHDFNNMLNVILGYTDTSLLQMDRGHPLYEAMTQIHLAAERSADLTRQLLAFSRKQITQPQVLNLNTLLENQSKMLDRLIGEDVELQFVPATSLWNVRLDPSQLDQILANLVVNARDAMPEGGTITIETGNVVLDEAYSSRLLSVEAGEYVLLAVSDSGKGLPPEMQEQIFEPFFTTKSKGEGTGLGLSTVYGIVQQNQGFIHLYSEMESGTTFKIYLPRVIEEAVQPTQEEDHGPLTGRETLLVVEDEEQLLELIGSVLEEYGYTVLAAGSPQQAMDLAAKTKTPIELMLTDVVMPGMNGKMLRARIQAEHPEIKTVYMSGYTDNVIVKQGMVEPGLAFIQKPFSMEGLARKVRRVLDADE